MYRRGSNGAGRGSTVRAQVYGLIRESIVSVTLLPGQALSENELAGHYGVSRTPVREALIQLTDEGLVDVVPQRGTFVSRISVRGVEEAQFIRETLERASLPSVAGRVTGADAVRLRGLLDEQRQAAADGDLQTWFACDEELHRALLEIAGHPRAWPVVQSAKAHMDRVRRLSLPGPRVLADLIAQHTEIVEHVLCQDIRAADKVLARHLRLIHSHLGRLREANPDYFADGEPDGELMGVR
ncbi:MAG: FCD domain-containing protein [Actinophytocola sp.]|nr:FCD domain-containing protein [Actinophytocola sp.]